MVSGSVFGDLKIQHESASLFDRLVGFEQHILLKDKLHRHVPLFNRRVQKNVGYVATLAGHVFHLRKLEMVAVDISKEEKKLCRLLGDFFALRELKTIGREIAELKLRGHLSDLAVF